MSCADAPYSNMASCCFSSTVKAFCEDITWCFRLCRSCRKSHVTQVTNRNRSADMSPWWIVTSHSSLSLAAAATETLLAAETRPSDSLFVLLIHHLQLIYAWPVVVVCLQLGHQLSVLVTFRGLRRQCGERQQGHPVVWHVIGWRVWQPADVDSETLRMTVDRTMKSLVQLLSCWTHQLTDWIRHAHSCLLFACTPTYGTLLCLRSDFLDSTGCAQRSRKAVGLSVLNFLQLEVKEDSRVNEVC